MSKSSLRSTPVAAADARNSLRVAAAKIEWNHLCSVNQLIPPDIVNDCNVAAATSEWHCRFQIHQLDPTDAVNSFKLTVATTEWIYWFRKDQQQYSPPPSSSRSKMKSKTYYDSRNVQQLAPNSSSSSNNQSFSELATRLIDSYTKLVSMILKLQGHRNATTNISEARELIKSIVGITDPEVLDYVANLLFYASSGSAQRLESTIVGITPREFDFFANLLVIASHRGVLQFLVGVEEVVYWIGRLGFA